jgi:hypothetical protein
MARDPAAPISKEESNSIFRETPGQRNAETIQRSIERDTDADVDQETNELHAAGATCALCGQAIKPGEDVRRVADGEFQHEACPYVPSS